MLLKLLPRAGPLWMQASLLNFILVQLQNKDMDRQRSQDIDDLIVSSFKFRLLSHCRRIRRQMKSVQKKNSVLISTDDIFNIVHEELHKLNAQCENALNLQLVPRMQYLALGIVIYIS